MPSQKSIPISELIPTANSEYRLRNEPDESAPSTKSTVKPSSASRAIRKADNIAVFGFMKADKARITATAVTAGKAVTAVLEISCVPFRF